MISRHEKTPFEKLVDFCRKSPFEQGIEAHRKGLSWVNCPYTGTDEVYERTEWLRGYRAHEEFPA